jgi:hypothetical protein
LKCAIAADEQAIREVPASFLACHSHKRPSRASVKLEVNKKFSLHFSFKGVLCNKGIIVVLLTLPIPTKVQKGKI